MLNIEVPGRRKTGTPQRRFVDTVKEDMQRVGGQKRMAEEADDHLW